MGRRPKVFSASTRKIVVLKDMHAVVTYLDEFTFNTYKFICLKHKTTTKDMTHKLITSFVNEVIELKKQKLFKKEKKKNE